MRRLLPLIVVFSLLLLTFVAFVPLAGAAGGLSCWTSNFIYSNNTASPGTVTLTLNDIPAQHNYTTTVTLQPGVTQTVSIYGFLTTGSGASSSANSSTLTFTGFGSFQVVDDSFCLPPVQEPAHFDDGRINAYDIGAPVTAYCADGGISVYDINDDNQGIRAFSVSLDDVHAALSQATSSGHNVLIGQGLGESLYALSSNQLSLVGPDLHEPSKQYQFITDGTRCG